MNYHLETATVLQISAFSKTRLLPELRRVLSYESQAVFLHFPLEEKGPFGLFYQLRWVLAKGRHLLQILLKALQILHFKTDQTNYGLNILLKITTLLSLSKNGNCIIALGLHLRSMKVYSCYAITTVEPLLSRDTLIQGKPPHMVQMFVLAK